MRVLVTGGSGFIGTNVIDECLRRGFEVANLDWHSPADSAQQRFWREANLLDLDRTAAVIADFRPSHVLHLAARTDLKGAHLDDYASNHVGTVNLISALSGMPEVKRVLFTSTSLVTAPGDTPTTDTEWRPHTAYGASKVAMERAIRARCPLPYEWVIARPASIWGPWMGPEYRRFVRLVARGYYFHIGRASPAKSMGYVGTAVWQLLALLAAERESVHGHVFYIGDGSPLTVRDWAEEIRRQLGARAIPTIPYPLAWTIGRLGDLARLARIPAPLHSFRLKNLVTEWVLPTRTTAAITGPSPFALSRGVAETIAWMRSHGYLSRDGSR